MSAEKLRVGIIGIGVYAISTHVPQLRNTGKVELVAISRRNPERLAIAQKALHIPQAYTDWREMLERAELDAVVVSTPHYAHTEPTLAALDRGLHVLVEKPMALTSQDAWSMVASAERAGRILMVGYNVRCAGIWRTVKRLLAEGLLGKIRQANLAICQYRRWFWESDSMPEDLEKIMKEFAESVDIPVEFFAGFGHSWRLNPDEMGGGTFVGTGTHWVDLMLWLAGAPPVEVVAFTETAGLPVDCFVNVQARLENGVLLSVTSADAVPQGIMSMDRHIMIVGDEGVLTDDREGSIWIHREDSREKLEADMPGLTVAAAFVSAVMEGGENLVPAHEGTYAVALTEAAYRSAREGSIVQIEYPADRLVAK